MSRFLRQGGDPLPRSLSLSGRLDPPGRRRRIGQIEVEHRQRQGGRSGYNLRRLSCGSGRTCFSVPRSLPAVGDARRDGGLAAEFRIACGDRRRQAVFFPNVTVGIPTVLVCLTFLPASSSGCSEWSASTSAAVFLQLHGKAAGGGPLVNAWSGETSRSAGRGGTHVDPGNMSAKSLQQSSFNPARNDGFPSGWEVAIFRATRDRNQRIPNDKRG